jgi:predicted dinucleotide-binding enzyme
MKIVILGAGRVAGALGAGWTKAGHAVMLAARDTQSASSVFAQKAGLAVRPLAGAAQGADAVLLATPWSAARETLLSAAPGTGQIVIDATNAYRTDTGGVWAAAQPSCAEQITSWLPQCKVVKAFNQTGAANLAAPKRYTSQPVMFVCGEDPAARETVLGLARDIGFDAVSAGDLRAARHLEALAHLWIHLAYVTGLGDGFSFTMQRLPSAQQVLLPTEN